MKQITLITLILLSFLSYSQAPPARTWYYNDYGKKTTVKERWFEDDDGLKHGKYIGYYSNAERQLTGSYSHGKKHGKWIQEQCYEVFFSEVCYTTILHYKNNVKHGSYKSMVKNTEMFTALMSGGKMDEYDGTFNTIGQYTDGKKTGYWKESFNEDEKVYQEGNYSKELGAVGKWVNTINVNGSFKTKKGYTSFFSESDGKFIKCTTPEGNDILEEALYEKASTIEGYENFLNKYPNSKYSAEITENLNRLLKQKKEL